MKICFPVQKDDGIESQVYNHFGSAPMFLIIDTESNIASTVHNSDMHHKHGACNPIMALDNNRVDAVIVGGIGGGALTRLNQSGIRVFRSAAESIKENIAMFQGKQLQEYTLQGCCGGHSHKGGCAH